VIFADTSALLAVLDRSDALHRKAAEWFREHIASSSLHTTDFVMDEVLTRLSSLRGPEPALRFAGSFMDDPRVTVVFVDRALFQAGVKEMRRYRDQSLSFTDCISFAVMRALGLRDAFSLDADFTRCGFHCVPELPPGSRRSGRRRKR
jgi:predicted nucleic acid-binding protein